MAPELTGRYVKKYLLFSLRSPPNHWMQHMGHWHGHWRSWQGTRKDPENAKIICCNANANAKMAAIFDGPVCTCIETTVPHLPFGLGSAIQVCPSHQRGGAEWMPLHQHYYNRTGTTGSTSSVVPAPSLPRVSQSQLAQGRLRVGIGTGVVVRGHFWVGGGCDMGRLWVPSLSRRPRAPIQALQTCPCCRETPDSLTQCWI